MGQVAGFRTVKGHTQTVYVGACCPKCGCDSHVILNASMPIINQCCVCGNMWNPDNVNPLNHPEVKAKIERIKANKIAA